MTTMQRRGFLAGLAAAGAAAVTGCASAPGGKTLRGYSVPAIDLHAHWVPQELVGLIEKEGAKNGAKIGKNARGEVTLNVPGIGYTFQPQYIDLNMRLKHMNDAGVDIHALSFTSPMVYWAPPGFGLTMSQVWNDNASAAHLRYPDRFLGLAMIPMQDPNLAVQEMDRAANLPGIRGIYMCTHINGKNLDDRSFWQVYERCEGLGLTLFLHPVSPVGADRMRGYYLSNFIGNPTDNAIAAASLMFGGVMDAFPKLEVVLPHAGGTFPWLIGRMDHGSAVRPETKHMTRAPSTYLRRFHYDTITHSVTILQELVRMVGSDRIVLGSDHPADMSYERPVDVVERITPLSASDRNLILGGNAMRLLKLTA